MNSPSALYTRREFLATSAKATASLMTIAGGTHPARSAPSPALMGGAEHCIFLWLGGGVAQIDTWDPKTESRDKGVKPGGYYASIATAVPGIRVCEHLKQSAALMERLTIVRSLNHEFGGEHAAATMQVHAGRPTTGTIRYPSIGSIVAHERGPLSDVAPAYVVVGLPSVARDPGFLGAGAGYLYVTDTEAGPTALRRHDDVTDVRQYRREQLLSLMRESAPKDDATAAYSRVIGQSLKLAGPDFMQAFSIASEPADLRRRYGGEFGQRCLLARRMVESGVRFVEVSHNLNFVNGTGWDTHNQGQLQQHVLIQELDRALATLVQDLEARRLLDKTLVVVATEFGRPGGFDSGGGRGHHPGSFSVVFAGGGLRHGQAVGVTDSRAEKIIERPVSVPDFLATLCAGMGINPAKELHTSDNRPVPLTDGGVPLRELFG